MEDKATNQNTMMNSLDNKTKVVLGLAIGDSLGATSEFQIPWEVTKNCIEAFPGWPAKLVGGGKALWNVGEPTDDTEMAMAILRAYVEKDKKVDPAHILRHFLKWADTMPKDIGATTRSALTAAKKGEWFTGGKEVFQRTPGNAANGSLMRNGVIGAIFSGPDEEVDAFDATIIHGIITHYGPLMVLCCLIQTAIIRKALLGELTCAPTIDEIKSIISSNWKSYQTKTQNEYAKMWLDDIGAGLLQQAEKRLIEELQGFESYDPWHQDYRGRSGYCILSLRIGLWALHWSFRNDHPTLPEWLPQWIFQRHGFDTIMWVVSIGADADTNGATAGPLLAAFHHHLNEDFWKELQVKDEIIQLMK